jgi:tol-pal system protein YbgF
MVRRLCILVLAVTPVAALAASREIQDLQRDVALLQEAVKQLQQSQDKQLAALLEAVRQAQDSAGKSNTSMAVLERTLQQSLQDIQAKVMTPVAGLSARMDGVSNDVRSLQQAVTDLTASMEKIQAQLTDISNAVKLLQAPTPPPPGQGGGGVGQTVAPGGTPGPAGGTMASQAPCMPSSDLYAAASRDRTGGKLDLALQGFQDYLRCYGNTEYAPNAQYYIGWIHYSQGDYPTAARDLDTVLERYPDSNKTPDAFYYKGLTLIKMGQRTNASEEFIQLIQRFPTNTLAAQACTQLKEMGKNCPNAHTPARSRKAKKG